MSLPRREFLKASAGAVASACVFGSCAAPESGEKSAAGSPAPPSTASFLASRIVPIADAERLERIEKARRLMAEAGIDAVLLEGGASLFYFTGVTWSLSERTFALVLPAKREMAWVAPKFEE